MKGGEQKTVESPGAQNEEGELGTVAMESPGPEGGTGPVPLGGSSSTKELCA